MCKWEKFLSYRKVASQVKADLTLPKHNLEIATARQEPFFLFSLLFALLGETFGKTVLTRHKLQTKIAVFLFALPERRLKPPSLDAGNDHECV